MDPGRRGQDNPAPQSPPPPAGRCPPELRPPPPVPVPPPSRHLLRSGMVALPPGALLLGALLGERRGFVRTATGERLGGGRGAAGGAEGRGERARSGGGRP